MKHKIDIVISYVNPKDKVWVDKYNKYSKDGNEKFKNKRFRDTSSLKYVLRSIDKYMNFINRVHLVVQTDSQVPSWVNRKTVNIVLHEEFIPYVFLPTFNCNTIEMFMFRIPNLSDRFIYFNDDMIINRTCSVDDFFNDGKCNLLSQKMNSEVGTNTWYNCLLNNTRIINKHLGKMDPSIVWYKFPHTVTPLYKPLCAEAYSIFEEEIINRTTRFREYKNFNQHFYAYYIENSDMCNKTPITVNYINLNKYESNFIKNAYAQTMCINDNVRSTDAEINSKHKLCAADLEKKFPKVSKYENGFFEVPRNDKDIDGILMYLNPNDKKWEELYREYISKENDKDEKSLSDDRIREMFSLKGILRSVNKNMKFIKKMHLVVQSESQVPKWINRDNVNVVLHEDFMPQDLLPTFNSHTIEMFLHKIPGLAERYIVFNDDMLIMKEHKEEDIFDGMIPKDMFYENKTENIQYHYSNYERYYDTHPQLRLHPHINNNMFAHNFVGREYDGDIYYRPNHGFVPFNKSFVTDIYEKYKNDIKRSCTKFRDDKNLYYYSYRLCNFLKNEKISLCTTDFVRFNLSPGLLMKRLEENNHDSIVINDDGLDSNYIDLYRNEVNKFIFKNFPQISKYEKDIKVAVCVVCKNEKNISAWVEHYKNLGFDNIIFWDNNDVKSKQQISLIEEYIKSGFVIYNRCIDNNDRKKVAVYKNCYKIFSDNFDWIAFFDVDEYLNLGKYKTIKDYLSLNLFEGCDIVQLDRKTNIYEGINVVGTYDNNLVKSILRTKNDKIIINNQFYKLYKYCTYSPTPRSKELVVKNSIGVEVSNTPYTNECKDVYIHHVHSTSFKNFLEKLKKGNPKENRFNHICLSYIEEELKNYFNYVVFTDEHLKQINETFPEFGITKETIFGGIDMFIKTDIDYVFPYVDDSDEEWYKEYCKYKGIVDYGNDILTGSARYRTYDLLKYKLRGIEQNMPWIRNIYMIVASPSQVPEWLDTTKVKIVYHKDIIPEEFLPTFNSSTIEMFLGNIEGLGERFIYGNDDFYVLKPVMPYMFFRGDKPLLYLKERNSGVPKNDLDKNSMDFHRNGLKLATFDIDLDSKYLYNPGHVDKPLRKSTCKYFLENHKEEMYKSCSRFRESKNMNQYLYEIYDVVHNRSISYEITQRKSHAIKDGVDLQNFTNTMKNNDIMLMSLDFEHDISNYDVSLLTLLMESKFKKKSSYEKE